MRNIYAAVLILLSFASCKKESDNILWSRSYGKGVASFVASTADSGILACGNINGKPYLIKLSSDKSAEVSYTADMGGSFTSAWCDTSHFVAAGCSGNKLYLSILNKEGEKFRDTLLTAGFPVERAAMSFTGAGSFLVIASADPDSSKYGATGLLFVRFDTTGNIILKKEVSDANFISAGDFTTDNSGNIFIALTRKNSGAKSRATVAKYNAGIQKIWETEIYNNPEVGSLTRAIKTGPADSLFVTGKTEVLKTDGTLDNSFIVSLSKSGAAGKKKYLENSNSGADLVFNGSNKIVLLNRNCFFINIVDPASGYFTEKVLMFSACNAYNTDEFGTSLDINYDGNFVVAGSVGNNFYLAVKPAR